MVQAPDEQPSIALNTLYLDSKISKVRYLHECPNNYDAYLVGTWDAEQNFLSIVDVYYGGSRRRPQDYFEKRKEMQMSASINDIFTENGHVAVGLENGNVEFFAHHGTDVTHTRTHKAVHGAAGSTAVCILDEEIISGSDDGSIVRIDMSGSTKPSNISVSLTSVKSMAVCGTHEFVSGHASGQVHLWDVRQINTAMAFGEIPTFSKAVAPLNDGITSISCHPAQPNVIAYGSHSGCVAFIDVRQQKQPLPSLLRVAQSPINEVKFHPAFASNAFALSNEAFLHLDISAGRSGGDGEPQSDVYQANCWLNASAWNMISLNTLISGKINLLSTFDVSPHSILCGSDTAYLALLTKSDFV